ncbi:DNA recombination protein RmuC [Helicobacter cappadocius]|uniref:DNA recombination protein RmuC n=1 Tax=Helicobacter cappadocius TaxID=3063998 RepID=A0AA90Q156_9HELI|nr:MULTISPECIES: DNA recombination protein RmuC [unclassified Helicobacter]MDO7252361.1 DNA recombination protein RmuC [Helicobacter sp. faydin-H75]MDP2538228.1 DNA recombination protein RmuC [Helicobacter sp. faydin-H76]
MLAFFVILSLILTSTLIFLWLYHIKSRSISPQINEFKIKISNLTTELDLQKTYYEKTLANEQEKLQNTIENLSHQNDTQKQYYEKRLADEEEKINALKSDINNTEKIKKDLKLEFENLTQKVLENKTLAFNHSQTKTLEPLQKDIKDFKEAFEMLKTEQTKERMGLLTEIKLLKEMNETISQEASNLTKALKGESKTRGNWGEMILESLLEKNGLIQGVHYYKQSNFKDEDSGKHYQPDIVLNLPDDRVIIIDAKLNLIAYDELIASETKEDIAKYTKNLLNNINTHFAELGSKKYHLLTQGKSPDFTIMFIPIEGAFIEAMRADPDLFNKAYNLRVVITSPSTLMSILMTINNLWKNEQIDKNYHNIISKLDLLNNKMMTFCKHMDDIGKGIETLQNRYEIANKTLKIGRGNIIDRIKTIQNTDRSIEYDTKEDES